MSKTRSVVFLIQLVLLGACSTTEPYLRLESGRETGSLSAGWVLLQKPDAPDIHLVGAVHIGDPAFYTAVQRELDGASIVLLEGVRGKNSHMDDLVESYGEMAELLDLSTQSRELNRRADWLTPDVHVDEIAHRLPRLSVRMRMGLSSARRRRARLATRLLTTDRAANKEEAAALASGALRRGLAESLVDRSDPDPLIILKRNIHLLEGLDRLLADENEATGTIAICYGTGHLEDLVGRLARKGWRLEAVTWHRVMSWPIVH